MLTITATQRLPLLIFYLHTTNMYVCVYMYKSFLRILILCIYSLGEHAWKLKYQFLKDFRLQWKVS